MRLYNALLAVCFLFPVNALAIEICATQSKGVEYDLSAPPTPIQDSKARIHYVRSSYITWRNNYGIVIQGDFPYIEKNADGSTSIEVLYLTTEEIELRKDAVNSQKPVPINYNFIHMGTHYLLTGSLTRTSNLTPGAFAIDYTDHLNLELKKVAEMSDTDTCTFCGSFEFDCDYSEDIIND